MYPLCSLHQKKNQLTCLTTRTRTSSGKVCGTTWNQTELMGIIHKLVYMLHALFTHISHPPHYASPYTTRNAE